MMPAVRLSVLLAVMCLFCTLEDAVAGDVLMRRDGSKVDDATYGRDGRFRVVWSQHPFRPLVKLLRSDRQFMCTGFVVSTRKVMTAAHCIKKRGALLPNSQRPRLVQAYNSELFQIVEWRAAPDFEGHEEWSTEDNVWVVPDHSQTSDDIAILTTRKNIAARTGTVTLRFELWRDTYVSVVGFHGGRRGIWAQRCCRARVYRSYSSYDRVTHRCDTSSGSSGSPLIVEEKDGRLRVVGVHVSANRKTGSGVGALLGAHQRTTDFILAEMASESAGAPRRWGSIVF